MAQLLRVASAFALAGVILAPASARSAPPSLSELTHAIDPSTGPATLSSPEIRPIDGVRIAHHARYVDGARVLDQHLSPASPAPNLPPAMLFLIGLGAPVAVLRSRRRRAG